MILHRLLAQRAAEGRPLRVLLIGAGKFGSMFLAQAIRAPGIHVAAVADRDPRRARESLARAGWPAPQFAARRLDEALREGGTYVTDDAGRLIESGGIDWGDVFQRSFQAATALITILLAVDRLDN